MRLSHRFGPLADASHGRDKVGSLLGQIKHQNEKKMRMMSEVFITCAVTGAGSAVERSPHVPVTPEQIADSAIEAARARAAVVHIHVRDCNTKRGVAGSRRGGEAHLKLEAEFGD